MNFLFDAPIEREDQDLLHRAQFAKQFADNLVALSQGKSFTISLNGRWGSGKTSLVNLIKREINENASYGELPCPPCIIDFAPWNVLEENAIITQFFDSFSSIFARSKIKKFLQDKRTQFAFKVLEDIPRIGKLFQDLHKLFDRYLSSFLGDEQDLLKIKNEISQKLVKTRMKYIVFIDDVDRLNNREIRLLIQLIKAVCDFPNVVYVLSFDRDIVASALKDEQNVDGYAYLEKIVQLSVDVPEPDSQDLQAYLIQKLEEVCKDLEEDEFDSARWSCIFHQGFNDYFRTLRDVNRYINSVQFKYENYSKVLDVVDFLTLDAIALFEPKLLNLIFNNRNFLCGVKFITNRKNEINDFRNEVLKISSNFELLATLFPILVYTGVYYGEAIKLNSYEKKARGRISEIDNLEFYFAGRLNKNGISKEDVRKVLDTNTPAQNDEYFAHLSNKAYNLFLQYLYGFSHESTYIHYIKRFMSQLLEYNLRFENLTTMLVLPNNVLLDVIVEQIHKFNRYDSMISFLKDLYRSTDDFGFLIYNMVNNAQGTDFYKNTTEGEVKYSAAELTELHEILVERIAEKMTHDDFVTNRSFITILSFLKNKNEDLIKEWYYKQNGKLLEVMEHLVQCGYGESATRFRTYLFRHDLFDDYVTDTDLQTLVKEDLERTANLVISDEKRLGEILFLMPQRKDEPYTLQEILAYCDENGIAFTYKDKFIDE